MEKEEIRCDERLRHIAFIMDGNGTWAKKRGLPRKMGHRAGAKTFRWLVDYMRDIGLQYMTVYAFSTENWARPKDEVDAIMKLLDDYLDEAERDFKENDVRIVFLGDKSPLLPSLREKMIRLEDETKDKTRILNIAVNYGAQDEILKAVNECIALGKGPVDKETFEDHLYTRLSPPPDLIVRTSGEQRLSNFLLWQAAYAEFYFTPKTWPDMKKEDFDEAILEFYRRKRKKGGLLEE